MENAYSYRKNEIQRHKSKVVLNTFGTIFRNKTFDAMKELAYWRLIMVQLFVLRKNGRIRSWQLWYNIKNNYATEL